MQKMLTPKNPSQAVGAYEISKYLIDTTGGKRVLLFQEPSLSIKLPGQPMATIRADQYFQPLDLDQQDSLGNPIYPQELRDAFDQIKAGLETIEASIFASEYNLSDPVIE